MFNPFPDTGARTLDSRTAFYYAYTLDSPAMVMRIPEVGSQYLMSFLDNQGDLFDGARPTRRHTEGHSRRQILVVYAL